MLAAEMTYPTAMISSACPDPSVVHRDRLAAPAGAERRSVAFQGTPGVVEGEVAAQYPRS